MKPVRLAAFRRRHGTRILVALGLIASLAFLSHSVTRLLRSQKEAQVVNVQIQRLNREVELMGRELNTTNAPQTFEELRSEEQRLLVNQTEFAKWTEQLIEHGVPLVLDVDAQAGAPVAGPLSERGVRIIPVTLELAPAKGISAVKPTYQRLLQFLHSVSQQAPRIDLVDLRVSAGPGGIERATAVLNVWVGDPPPAANLATANNGGTNP